MFAKGGLICAIYDFVLSIDFLRVARKVLSTPPFANIFPDNGPEFIANVAEDWSAAHGHRLRAHTARQAHAECIRGALKRVLQAKCPRRSRVRDAGPGADSVGRMDGGLQQPQAARHPGRLATRPLRP